MNCSPQGSSVHGILQARIPEWVAISFSRDLPKTEIKPTSPECTALAGRFFTTEPSGKSLSLTDDDMKLLSHVWLFAIPWTVAYEAPPSLEFSRQEYQSGLPFLSHLLVLDKLSSVQSLSHIRLFVTPWTTAHQASLSITNSWSLLKLTSIESVMLSNHLILYCPLLLSPSIFPSIRIFSNESVIHITWPKYWSFIFSISPSNEYSELISFKIDCLDLLAVQGTLKSLLPTTAQKYQFFSTQLCL